MKTKRNYKENYKEKKFKIVKGETGIAVYNWAYQCPKCKSFLKYDFGKWAFENSGGVGIECPVCHKFGQVITPKDVEAAELISQEEFAKLTIIEDH